MDGSTFVLTAALFAVFAYTVWRDKRESEERQRAEEIACEERRRAEERFERMVAEFRRERVDLLNRIQAPDTAVVQSLPPLPQAGLEKLWRSEQDEIEEYVPPAAEVDLTDLADEVLSG